jgi:hypothetical protein
MKISLLVLGVTMFIIGIQDGIRIIADNNAVSILSWIPGEISLYIGLDVALVTIGAFVANHASHIKPSKKH